MSGYSAEEFAQGLAQLFRSKYTDPYHPSSEIMVYRTGEPAPIGFFDKQGQFHNLEPTPCYEEMMVPYPQQ